MNNILKLTEISCQLSPRHLKFANGVLEGKTQEQAYIDAGYAAKGANGHASRLVANGSIKKYLELAKKDAQAAAQETLIFDEYQWLLNQKRLLSMSMGDTTVRKYSFVMEESVEVEVKETNLAAANKAQELIARRMGWLTDNKKVPTEPVLFQIDLG